MKLALFTLLTLLFSCQTEKKQGTYTGINHKGESMTCTQMKTEGAICTEMYTESDAYADKCKKEGKKVIQCGCHEYICLDN